MHRCYEYVAFVFVLAAAVRGDLNDGECQFPPPADGFTDQGYAGVWYEVARMQAVFDAFFQYNTTCAAVSYSPTGEEGGGGELYYTARKGSTDGEWNNATARLDQQAGESAGVFEQTFLFGDDLQFEGQTDPYYVVWLDSDSSIAYSCNEIPVFGGIYYGVHLQSRTRDVDPVKLAEMYDYAVNVLELNVLDRPFVLSPQAGC